MLFGKNIFPFLLLMPILFTPFIYSGELYNGIISAKQIWFYAAMSLLLAGTGFQLLFQKRSSQIALNRVDIALLLFYGYLTIRAATTQFIPMLHNVRFVNYSLCVVLYFIVKMYILNAKSQGCQDEIYLNTRTRRYEEEEEEEENLSGFVSLRSILYRVIAFLILTGLAQAIWGLLQLYGFLPSFNSSFKITGTFYNPAPYALYLAAIFPMALGSYLFSAVTDGEAIKLRATLCQTMRNYVLKLLHKGTRSTHGVSRRGIIFDAFLKDLSLLTIIAILFVLPATMIRAAWLGALAGSLFVLQYKYQYIQSIQKLLNTQSRRITAIIIMITLFAVIGTGLFHLKKDSANGKLFIWEVTLGKIAEKPLFGHGIGRFEAEYNNWQAEYFLQNPEEMDGMKAWVAGNTKYAFNEFLELASETGFVGLALFLTLIAMALFSHFKNISSSNLQIFSSLMALLIPMFISFPLFSLPTFILFFILLGLGSSFVSPLKLDTIQLLSFTSNHPWKSGQALMEAIPPNINNINKQGKFPIGESHPTGGQVGIKLIALATFTLAIFLTISTLNQFQAYYYWDEAYKLYNMKAYSDACLSCEKGSNELQYDGLFLKYHGKVTYMNKQYEQAGMLFKHAQNLTSDEVLYIALGDNYKALTQFEQAEYSYQYAATMAPVKFYPLYLLAKLYNETCQYEKAKAVAQKLLEKKIKIESATIDTIKAEMINLIDKQMNTENMCNLKGRVGSTTPKSLKFPARPPS